MRRSTFPVFAAMALAILLLAGGQARAQSASPFDRVKPLADKVTIRIALNPGNVYSLAAVDALEKGYFARANLDVQITKFTQSSVTLAPMLARGDLDIAPQTPSPSFFNLIDQGFGAKAVSVFSIGKEGRAQEAWLMLTSDKAGEIKDFADLKGKIVETGPIGSTVYFLALSAIQRAELTPGQDVTMLTRIRGIGDFLALAKTRSQDVISVIEPLASQVEREGYGKRWKTLSDLAPWAQTVIMVASQQFLDKNGPALRKFLEVYLLTSREINAANGVWNDDLMATATKWTGLSDQIIRDMGGVIYFDPNGEVSTNSLARFQDIWTNVGELKHKTSLDVAVDKQPVADALGVIGRAR